MSKTRVCHVVCGLVAGGVESMIYNYCSRMDESKFDWYLIYQHSPSEKNIKEFENLKFNLKEIPSKVKHPIKNYMETYKYLKENKIDVVHCHMTLMNIIPLIAAKKLKIKVRICHSHNSDVRRKNYFISFFEKICKKLNIRFATHLVACGEDAGRYLFDKENFLIINNAIDLNKFVYNEDKREKIRKKFQIGYDDVIIGHIGRFTNQKNHIFLVNLIERFRDLNVKMMLIGDGENYLNIKNIIKERKLEDKVYFVGIVDNPSDYYSAFDIFVLPSLWEGLPVVGIEAQASGLKCLCSENVDKTMKITNNIEFIDINNLSKYETEIKRIIENKDYRNRKIEYADFNNKGLNITNEIEKLERIYLGKE